MLATYGIPTQTAKQIEPLTLNSPGDLLIKVYSTLETQYYISIGI